MARHGIRHTYLTGPWHMCSRCDTRQKVAEMQWQRGFLLCDECLDTGIFPLVGMREPAIAQVLNDGKEELAPVEKLRNPEGFEEEEEFII